LVGLVVAEVSPRRLSRSGINWQALTSKGVLAGFGAGQSVEALIASLQTGEFVMGSIDPKTTSVDIGGRTVLFPNNYVLSTFLQDNADFNLLASPRLLTHNNKAADISVGRVIPFATGVKFDINGQPIVTFDYREVGLDVKITPHISQGQVVRLEVHQGLQEVVDFFRTGTGATAVSVPIVSKREVNTQVSLGDGQTLVIGGLVQKKTIASVRKIPGLGDIPLLGPLLFSRQEKTQEKTTLLMFITPHIVDSPQKLKDITKQYEQLFQRSMKGDSQYLQERNYEPKKEAPQSVKDPAAMPIPGPSPAPVPMPLILPQPNAPTAPCPAEPAAPGQ